MAQEQTQLVLAFAQAVTELVTVEKKNIVVLTEIARDALQTEPQAAPSLAALITNRILQAPASQKLPVLYLLDSISKTVGEPYKTLFAPALPEAYMCTWQQGGPGLHRPLDKLLGTWTGVFPARLLSDIQGRVAAQRAAQAPLQVQPAAAPVPAGVNGYGVGYAATVPAVPQQQQLAPMAADPRLAQQPLMLQQPIVQQQPVLVQQPLQQQQQQPGFGMPPMPQYEQQQQPVPYQQPGYAQFPQQQQQQQQPMYYQQPAPQQQQPPYALQAQQQQLQAQQVSVPDLLSSLMTAGLLAAPGAQQSTALLGSGGSGAHSTPPYPSTATATPPYAGAAATATPEREQPASTNFTPERIKEHNPSAVARLLRQTEATKSRFLDRKFLRRQQKQAGAAGRTASRLWYVELDTWMASTVGAAAAAAAGNSSAGGARAAQQQAAAAAEPQSFSVPVDDSQTVCALSGEQFEQFWDEGHQEWRYKGAKRLDAEEAASYGVEEGAIVLVSALGRPAASVLQAAGADAAAAGAGGGVLAELAAQQEIAADLAAAAADVAPGSAPPDTKDVKPSLKHPLDEGVEAAAAGEQQPQEKRARLT